MKNVFRLGFVLLLLALAAAAQVGGTWSNLSAASPFTGGGDTALVLTDGTVLVHDYLTVDWFLLSPDNKGNYMTGTWSKALPLPAGYAPLYFASAVLANGQVIVEGGEYNAMDMNIAFPNRGTMVWTTRGALYDPVTQTWAAVAAPKGWGDANNQNGTGDAQSVVLADGRFMLAEAIHQAGGSKRAAFYTPAKNPPWKPSTSKGKFDFNDEENWNLIPGGKVLTVDAYTERALAGRNSELYNPATDSWASAGDTKVCIADVCDPDRPTHEVGPAVLRPDGTIIQFGSTSQGFNNVYDTNAPGWKNHDAAWDFPSGLDVQDGPAALLPCGNVLVQASDGLFGNQGSTFFEFDGTATTQITNPPANAANVQSYQGRMVVLPNGQILYSDGTATLQLYTANPACGPDAGSAPTITNFPPVISAGNVYQISGTLFNGKSQGASYGNDAQSATNYPLVRLINFGSGDVTYCRTFGHSSMGVATGNLIVTTNFECPNTIEPGLNTLYVVANGIAGGGVQVEVR